MTYEFLGDIISSLIFGFVIDTLIYYVSKSNAIKIFKYPKKMRCCWNYKYLFKFRS